MKLILQPQRAPRARSRGIIFSRSNRLPLRNKGYHGDVFYLGLPGVRLETGPRYFSPARQAGPHEQRAGRFRKSLLSLGVLLGWDLRGLKEALGEERWKGPTLQASLAKERLSRGVTPLQVCSLLIYTQWGVRFNNRAQ